MKTIAIANQKGGTGKTTTTYNLSIALTQQGYRVLMVDFDPQGNLSCYCGIPPEKDLDQTITELLMKTSCEKPIGVCLPARTQGGCRTGGFYPVQSAAGGL